MFYAVAPVQVDSWWVFIGFIFLMIVVGIVVFVIKVWLGTKVVQATVKKPDTVSVR